MRKKCQYCSLTHEEDMPCPIKDDPIKYICGNCSGNHSANSVVCPHRDKYIKMKTLLQHSTQQKSFAYTNNYTADGSDFMRVPEQHEPTSKPVNFSSINTNNISYANIIKHTYFNKERPHTNSLFSSTEIFTVFKDVVSTLRNCATRDEQFNALFQIVFKYVIND